MEIGDSMYVVVHSKPIIAKVIGISDEGIVLEHDGGFAFVMPDDVFDSRAEACVAEATQQRRNAADARRRAAENQAKADEYENRAIALLKEANALLRKEV